MVPTAVAVRERVSRGFPPGQLDSLDVYITSRCNRRCKYCFLPRDYFDSGASMTLDRFEGIIEWAHRTHVSEITLLGGEPSLHPDFVAMVDVCAARGLLTRVVTNGSRAFRRHLASGALTTANLHRAAVSLDTLDASVQDSLRGVGAFADAMATVDGLRVRGITFDINVTAVSSVLDGIPALVSFAEDASARRVNIHWPSAMGLGSELAREEIPSFEQWTALRRFVQGRGSSRPSFFVEVERAFLADDAPLRGCALVDGTNLQVLPDGSAFRCGVLIDRASMSTLRFSGSALVESRGHSGESALAATAMSCDACPAAEYASERRACIYDKVRSPFAE